jgi:hypothetical protein
VLSHHRRPKEGHDARRPRPAAHYGVLTADDLLPEGKKNARRRLTDAEVVTLCVAQSIMGICSDERFAKIATKRLGHLFPAGLGTGSVFPTPPCAITNRHANDNNRFVVRAAGVPPPGPEKGL